MKKIEDLIVERGFGPDDIDRLDNEIQDLINRGLIVNYLSPNSYLLTLVVLAAFLCYFISAHLLVDKFFFKNFYENASFVNAIRRGIIISLVVGLFLLFRLYRVEFYVLLLLPVVGVLIEILIVYYGRKAKLDKDLDSVEIEVRS